jgi:hypothetical protein
MACCGGNANTRNSAVAGAALGRSGCILCKIWAILTRGKEPGGDPCVVIPGHIARKPDPCIYDQFMLMQLGKPVTWDNPDVRILLNGVEQYTYNLAVSTDYDVEVTVHNSSRDKAANATSVDVEWIEFGAGGQIRHPITVQSVDVPIWPGTVVVSAKWRTPDVPGHYCIEVDLAHPDDGNPGNNRGWNNTQVFAAQSPVAREVRIFNRYPGDCPKPQEGRGPEFQPHRVLFGWAPLGAVAAMLFAQHLHVDMSFLGRIVLMLVAGYAVGAAVGGLVESRIAAGRRARYREKAVARRRDPIDCHLVHLTVDSYRFDDRIGKEFDPAAAFTNIPALWNARVEPPSFVFVPGEAFRDVVLHVDAPDDPGPDGQFNVTAWQGGVPTGGVTVTVTTGG